MLGRNALGLLMLSAMPGLLAAEDFRLENRVFSGDSKTPATQSTTIFYQGLVYDYLQQPPEVIVFDRQAGRFLLLDSKRQLRAELTTAEVAAITNRVQQWAAAQKDPMMKFMAAPQFEERFDESAGVLTMASQWMTYRVQAMRAGSQALAEQYREFSDWYARLNAMLTPGSRPPFARLIVNAALAKRETLARQATLTLTPPGPAGTRPLTLRSEHELARALTEADLRRVAETRKWLETFRLVGFAEYRKPAGK